MGLTPPRTPLVDGPFDLDAVSQRAVGFMLTVVGANPAMMTGDAVAEFRAQFQAFLLDASALIREVGRLYDAWRGLRERHLPFAGEPGAPTVCTGCSLHGVQVPWPCEPYTAATRALPERTP